MYLDLIFYFKTVVYVYYILFMDQYPSLPLHSKEAITE